METRGGASGGSAHLLALAEMLFIGTDALPALLHLGILWLLASAGAIALVIRALLCRGELVARWLLGLAGWVVVAAGVLPVALVALTSDGAIRSC